MKKFYCLLAIFLSANFLFSCTAPSDAPVTTGTSTIETTEAKETILNEPATEAPTAAETDIQETEADTTEEIVAAPYPDTVYVHLSSEDIDSRTQSYVDGLPFELKSGLFITEETKYTHTVEENRADQTVTLFGNEHTVSYVCSMISSTEYGDSYDIYENENIRYNVSRDGRILSYTCPGLHRGTSNTPLDNEAAMKIATEFIETYYSEYDFSDYTVSIYRHTGGLSSSRNTVVKYIKRSYGYFFEDKLELHINSDGIVSLVMADKLGCSAVFSEVTEQQFEIAREQLFNAIIAAARTPVDNRGYIMIGSDGNLYMYMDGTGWTFNDEGMIDDNSQEVTETYYIRLNP